MNPRTLVNKASRGWRSLLSVAPLLACSSGMALTAGIPMLQTTAPVIDGVIDTAYTQNHNGYPIANTIGEGVVDNLQDFQARWWGVWDETNLYIFIQVTDQFMTDSHGSAAYQNDVVEIYFNMDNVRDPAGNARTGDNYQYALNWNKLDEKNVTENGSFEGVEWAQVTTDTGYTVEIVFPWTTLTSLDIEQGMEIGFDIAVNDNDGNSTYDAVTYWYSDSALWGNMDPAGTVRLEQPTGFTTIPMVAEEDVPTIDGVVDPIYLAAKGNVIDKVSTGVVDSPTDFSAQWWGLWDDEKLYIVVKVTDQFLTSTAGAAIYQNDLIEVYFNMDNVRFPAGHARTGDNYQYSFKWNNPAENAVSGSATMEGVEFAETTTDDGYIMEIAFPWSTLTTELTPAVDFAFGFDIAVNDNDGKAAHDSTRYWNSTKALWSNMDTAGTVGLGPLFGGNYPPVIAPVAVQKINQGAELAFDVVVSDPDVDDTISFTAEYLPDFIALTDNEAGVATLTATVPAEAELGVYQFNLIASDGELSDSKIITVIVTDPDVPMQPPVFIEPYPVALNAGQSVTFDVGVIDIDSLEVIVDDNPQGFARLGKLAEDATAPAIDGVIEDVYSAKQEIGRLSGASSVVTNAEDFSATWQATWDDEKFYLAIDVTDESLNDSAGAAAWQNDVVEVYFNMDNVRAPAGHARTGDNYQYAFNWNKLDEQNVTPNGSFEGIEWTQINTDKGYVVEVAFPWETLTTLTIGEGFTFGFDIAINDNDGGETYDAVSYWNSDHALWGNMDGSGMVMLGLGPSIATVVNKGGKTGAVTITTTEETELGDYVVTIIAKDEQSNFGILNLTVSVTPDTWNGFPRDGNWVDTGSLMGMIYIGAEPWIYSEDAGDWFYLDADSISDDGAWIFVYTLVTGELVEETAWAGYLIDSDWVLTPAGYIYVGGDLPWAYFLDLGAWAYTPEENVSEAGAWIFLASKPDA